MHEADDLQVCSVETSDVQGAFWNGEKKGRRLMGRGGGRGRVAQETSLPNPARAAGCSLIGWAGFPDTRSFEQRVLYPQNVCMSMWVLPALHPPHWLTGGQGYAR